jgi:hypothetical protein
MGCETLVDGPGVTVIACSRGAKRKSCSVEGCGKSAPYLCDFPLAGRLAGKTCSRALCESHRRYREGLDYCPPHTKTTLTRSP